MNIQDLNKWSAEVCGVTIGRYPEPSWFAGQGDTWVECDGEWTLEDPRCRQVFREWWLNQDKRRYITMTHDEVWYFVPAAYAALDEVNAKGKTELACAWAIYEARNE